MKKTYVVCSYGGCGSKMLCNFIKNYYDVIHLHDSYPPEKLTRPVFRLDPLMSDYHFSFNDYIDPKNYVIIYIYRNPVNAFLSRGVHPSPKSIKDLNEIKRHPKNHVESLLRKWDENGLRVRVDKPTFIDIDDYINKNSDLMNCGEHFFNYINESNKNYSVIAINYDKMINNIEDILNTLNIPLTEINKFPIITETHKNIPKKYFYELTNIYKDLINTMNDLPPVKIIQNKCNYEN